MTRNLIEANKSIFLLLDRYCSSRGLKLANLDKPRWIASEPKHRHFMIAARTGECIHFAPTRKLARLNLDQRSFLISVGFEHDQHFLLSRELDTDASFVTVALSELQPRPARSPHEIREIVEWSDKEADPSYIGHEYERIASLFPRIRVYDVSDLRASGIWSLFFRICTEECDAGLSWIDGRLSGALRAMCELDQERVPYKVLCRSIFDSDKSSFFLALYRCLEALYAYSSARQLSAELNIESSWAKVATILEDKLGWHPREEGSLAQIMRFSSRADLVLLLRHLEGQGAPEDHEAASSRAARAVYRLRNSIVHYRPSQYQIDVDKYDWSSICEALVGVVLDVYAAVFEYSAP